MKFRKKPVVVDAVQFTEALRDSILFDGAPVPTGMHRIATSLHPPTRRVWSATFCVDSRDGPMQAIELDDWIVTNAAGEVCPCKPDIFAATYEPADAPAPALTQNARGDELEALRAIQDRNVLLDAAIAALDDLIADGHAHYRVADVLRAAIEKAEGRSHG